MLIKDIHQIPSFLAGDHTVLKEILHPKNDNVNIGYSIAYASLDTGKKSLPHRLKSSEVYIILQGSGRIFINEENKSISKGQLIFVPPNATQYVENTGNEPLTFLCIVHPEWREDEEDVF